MLDYDSVKQNAQGRWLSIWRALGIDLREDGKHGPCPVCSGGKKNSDRFRLDKNSAERGTWFCGQCDPHAGDGIALVQNVLDIDFKETMSAIAGVVMGCEKKVIPKEKHRMTKEKLRKMFDRAKRASENDMVGDYIKGRGLNIIPYTLWHSPKCWESETKSNVNAMIAVFSMPGSEVGCLHRTYLDQSRKMDIESPKKLTPTCVHNIAGGAIRLFDPYHDGTIAVSEGIETAIAVKEMMGLPCWSVVSAELMKKFVPPKEIKNIIICGDNDLNFVGQSAAYDLGKRLKREKYSVSILLPDQPGTDFLDEYLKYQEEIVL